MVWATVATAVAGSLLSSSQSDDSWKDSARQAGRNTAQVDASRQRAQAMLAGQAREVSDAALNQQVQVQQNEEAAVANATVQAAASGSSGANVDQTISTHQANAERAKLAISKQRQSAMAQIGQQFEDLEWQARGQKYKTSARGGQSAGMALAGAALSGLGAYAGAKKL